jgi:putative membrane protein
VTALRLARSELKRMTGGLLPKLTVMALTLVPLLYGAVYLYANWNPYGNLDRIDAALVVEDAGADAGNGTRLEAGQKVADSLLDGHVFNWQTVPTAAEADQGVSDGKYAFALKIPKDFSANLASPGSFDSATQAMLNVTTNDANNYLLSTIVDKLTTAVHASVAKEVGAETANQLLTGFGTIHTQMVKAADGAAQLADGVTRLHDGTATLHEGTGKLEAGAADLHNWPGQAP